MLQNAPVCPTIPVQDMDRAKKFYAGMLGLTLEEEDPAGVVMGAGKGTKVYLYQRGQSKADHTLASFMVENIEDAVSSLRAKGVTFEEYDMPEMGIKTVNGIATMGGMKGAWFRDSEGNILSLSTK